MHKRVIYCYPKVSSQLIELKATREEKRAIRAQLLVLADRPELGYRILFLEEKIYRYDVGRFRLHYTYSDLDLSLLTVDV
jgi:mRNA-degrading endonuclease RelE of RelBE toxin-antitoxin system